MLTEKLNEIINDWFKDTNIEDPKDRINYIILCNHYEILLINRTYKTKQFKKLKKKFKREINNV